MKPFYLSLACLLLVVRSASAEIITVPYEADGSWNEKMFGYKIERQEGAGALPFLRLTIPPKSAKLFHSAWLEILDAQGKTLAETSFSATHGSNGSLVFTVNLQGPAKARLIIQTDMPEEYALNVPNPGGGFGGYSFDVPAAVATK